MENFDNKTYASFDSTFTLKYARFDYTFTLKQSHTLNLDNKTYFLSVCFDSTPYMIKICHKKNLSNTLLCLSCQQQTHLGQTSASLLLARQRSTWLTRTYRTLTCKLSRSSSRASANLTRNKDPNAFSIAFGIPAVSVKPTSVLVNLGVWVDSQST
jgi:hypothetical protein